MKKLFAVFVSLGAMAFAQDMKTPTPQQPEDQGAKRRLESVTWDLNSQAGLGCPERLRGGWKIRRLRVE
jgi:hypothetical protein